MSSPKYSLILSPQAREDYEDILAYTERTWGEEQLYKYDRLVQNGLTSITDNPRLGRKRAGLPEGYRVYQVGRHLIAYRLEGSMVYVARILHERMDVTRHIK